MTKAHFTEARQRTLTHLRDAGIEHHMLHGPASDSYWAAPLRVLAVNMESYGYDECGHWNVDYACLLDWMYDRGDTGTKTVRYTLAIIKALTDAHATQTPPGPQQLRTAYANAPALEAILRQTAYYNIRPTSNPQKPEDAASIVASGSTPLSDFVREEMLALAPNVILVSGHSGLAAFNAMWRLEPALHYLGSMRHPCGAVIQSIRHPSRPNYAAFANAISNALQQLNAA
jgi:hypothetical protein